MNFRILGNRIEYIQAAKRLEELANASPGTPEAAERKELIDCFRNFEKEVYKAGPHNIKNIQKNKKKKIDLFYLYYNCRLTKFYLAGRP
jgi:hypothetical protein